MSLRLSLISLALVLPAPLIIPTPMSAGWFAAYMCTWIILLVASAVFLFRAMDAKATTLANRLVTELRAKLLAVEMQDLSGLALSQIHIVLESLNRAQDLIDVAPDRAVCHADRGLQQLQRLDEIRQLQQAKD